MAYMNCSRFSACPQAVEAVMARQALRALKALRGTDTDSPIEGESRGPGWFDSSWELGKGLDVCEGLPADAGLDEWLAVFLR